MSELDEHIDFMALVGSVGDRVKGGVRINEAEVIELLTHPGIPRHAHADLLDHVMRGYDPWAIVRIWNKTIEGKKNLDLLGAFVLKPLYEELRDGGDPRFVCACGKEYQRLQGLAGHMSACPTHKEHNTEMESIIPTTPSNRHVLQMVERWGGVVHKRKSDKVIIAFPGTDEKIALMAETQHDANPTETFIALAKLLGVSQAEFWAGPPEPDEPNEVQPTDGPIRRRHKGYIHKVTDCLIQAGCPMTIERIAEECGITIAQASSAASRLASQDVLARLKSGLYVAVEHAADYKVGMDITVGAREPEETPQEPAGEPDGGMVVNTAMGLPGERPGTLMPEEKKAAVEAKADTGQDDDMDTLIEDFLDMIFPQGFKARHLKAIAAWQDATKTLFREVGE